MQIPGRDRAGHAPSRRWEGRQRRLRAPVEKKAEGRTRAGLSQEAARALGVSCIFTAKLWGLENATPFYPGRGFGQACFCEGGAAVPSGVSLSFKTTK